MEVSVITAVIAAVVTGVVTGLISSLGTVSAIRVHIQYLRETLQKHDERLRDVERDTRQVVGALEKGAASFPAAPIFKAGPSN